MFLANDILPAATPLGSCPVGSVITIMLQVAETSLITVKTVKNNINPRNKYLVFLFIYYHPLYKFTPFL